YVEREIERLHDLFDAGLRAFALQESPAGARDDVCTAPLLARLHQMAGRLDLRARARLGIGQQGLGRAQMHRPPPAGIDLCDQRRAHALLAEAVVAAVDQQQLFGDQLIERAIGLALVREARELEAALDRHRLTRQAERLGERARRRRQPGETRREELLDPARQ